MKTTILKFGLCGGIASIILFGLALLVFKDLSYTLQEVMGYASMILALSFVFFGIKHFRDQKNNGKVTFQKAFLIGIAIAIFTGLGTAIMDYIYTSYINPDFAQEYLASSIESMKETLSSDEFQAKKIELEKQMEQYGSPGFMAFIMFATVVLLGLVITLISSLVLQKK